MASVQRSLKRITMRYKDSVTGVFENISPDMVYNKMTQHAALLPEFATQWLFCLPLMFYNVLSFQLQNQITKDKYTLSNPVDIGTKTAQIDSMTACRDQSYVSNKSIEDISSQI